MKNEQGLKLLKEFKRLGFYVSLLTGETGTALFNYAELAHPLEGISPLSIDLHKIEVTNEEFKTIFNL
jgi:hypothetical protein